MSSIHQLNIQKDWISFSPGVIPAFTTSVMVYTNPGDKIIIQPPVYHPFFTSILNMGRQLVQNQLKFENNSYYFDFDDLKKQIDSRTKMIILSHPHNPVGKVWTKEELTELANICLKNNILIVSDEIHSDLVYKNYKHIPIASISEEVAQNSVALYAPSKTFNLAGLSTSVLVVPNKKLKKTFDNFINDFHLHGGNIFGNVALEAAYTKGKEWLDELIDYLSGNVDLVRNFAKKHSDKMDLIEPGATYLLWLNFRKLNLTDKELENFFIKKAKLGMNSGTMFGKGGEGFHRMNVACPRSIVLQALDQLDRALNSL
jgi:cystathionine beta-lyase